MCLYSVSPARRLRSARSREVGVIHGGSVRHPRQIRIDLSDLTRGGAAKTPNPRKPEGNRTVGALSALKSLTSARGSRREALINSTILISEVCARRSQSERCRGAYRGIARRGFAIFRARFGNAAMRDELARCLLLDHGVD